MISSYTALQVPHNSRWQTGIRHLGKAGCKDGGSSPKGSWEKTKPKQGLNCTQVTGRIGMLLGVINSGRDQSNKPITTLGMKTGCSLV